MGLKAAFGVLAIALLALAGVRYTFDLQQVVEALSGLQCSPDGVCTLFLLP